MPRLAAAVNVDDLPKTGPQRADARAQAESGWVGRDEQVVVECQRGRPCWPEAGSLGRELQMSQNAGTDGWVFDHRDQVDSGGRGPCRPGRGGRSVGLVG